MKKTPGIRNFLMEHAKKDPVSFHMPGHKGSSFYRRFDFDRFFNEFADYDITEIIGADNLFQTEGIIEETMRKYRELYNSKASYLLINGTSGGIIASILATVNAGKKLVLARNCHKSVFNALGLASIKPVYAHPGVINEYGIAGPIEASEIDRLLVEEPDAEAVILPSPNYYGICSDIEAIATVVHSHGKKLIVDQAHGAHLRFFSNIKSHQAADSLSDMTRIELPAAAEDCGADIVINSTHKTLASLTQSAVLNVCGDIDLYTLEDKLQAIESTSPSYLLMASLDINADIISEFGEHLFSEWRSNLEYFYEHASEIAGLKLMQISNEKSGMMDLTKINLDMSAYGLDGNTLEEELLKDNIFAELVTGNILMCMSGIGNTRNDYKKLLASLKRISSEYPMLASSHEECAPHLVANKQSHSDSELISSSIWTKRRVLHETGTAKLLLDIDLCEGRICASSIIPYPPGIPLVCPGEELSREDIEYIKCLRARGEKVIGIDPESRIAVLT